MTAFYQTKQKVEQNSLFHSYFKMIKLLYYAVTHCEAPAVLYNLTAAASCTSSGACAGETPLYSSGATESQVDCRIDIYLLHLNLGYSSNVATRFTLCNLL